MGGHELRTDTMVVDGPARGNAVIACRHGDCPHPDWWNHRLCDPCNLGSHLCTGVACYGCESPAHDRKPGVSGLGDEPLVHTGQRDQGSALLGKPAHTRGGRR